MGLREALAGPPHGGYWEQEVYPLADAQTIADIDAFDWPQPSWYDYSVLRDKAAAHPERAIMYGYIAIFYFHNLLRGLELSLMDLALRPEFSAHLIRRIAETFFDLHQAGFEAAGDVVDICQVTDDYGSQTGLLISPRMFETYYRPWIAQAIDLIKPHGIKVFHHDDGAIRKLIPDFIDLGIDVLNPIQWRCPGMEQAGLAEDFGGQVCFHGGVDNQHTLALWLGRGCAGRGGLQPEHAGRQRHRLHPGALSQHPGQHAGREYCGYV